MIFGLPLSTFLLVVGLQILAIVLAVVYGVTFKDDDRWLTVEDVIESVKRRINRKGRNDNAG